MLKNATSRALEAAEIMADVTLLSQQLGSPEGLAALSSISNLLRLKPVADLPGLKAFLSEYQSQVLLPLDLPCIHQAFLHASQGQVRELIELDRTIGKTRIPEELTKASKYVGQRQLHRLRPLKDNRTVQRYLLSVDEGKAVGWHTLVYGLILAVYTVPLRQGFVHYARQTQLGFINAATQTLRLTPPDLALLQRELDDSLVSKVQDWLDGQGRPALSIV